mgnify:CR=1 FL=1|jgi:hypothetical protein
MAITGSGFLIPTFLDVFDATALNMLYLADTMKIALFSDTITQDYGADTAYNVAPYDANEVSGGDWSAGGYTLATKTLAESKTGYMVWDAADVSQTNTTLASAMGGLIYDDTLAGKNGLVFVDFVTAVSTTAGTLQITWTAAASGGICNIKLDPAAA